MTNTEERKTRLEKILKLVPEKSIETDKFIAKIMVKWGFSRRTILEYITCLITAGEVQSNVTGSMIWKK